MALQWQFTDNFMGYVSYAEGFNSGGVSAPTSARHALILPYKPSTLENFEVGMRSDLLDGQLRFNATVFDTDWVDLQAAGVVYDPVTGAQIPTLVTTNVGEAEAKGVEVELTFLPTENLHDQPRPRRARHGVYGDQAGHDAGHLPLTTGTEFAQAPDTSYTVGFQHTANTDSGGSLVSRLDYNYQGQFWRSEPFLRVDAYQAVPDGYEESGDWGILNLRVSYEPADANWQAAIFGTNLTDEYMHQLRVLPRHLGLRLRDGGSSSRGRRVPDVPLLRRPKVGGAHAPPIADELQALASNRQRLFLGRGKS